MMDFKGKLLEQYYGDHEYPVLVVDLPSRGKVYSQKFVGETGKVVSLKLDGKAEEWSAEPFFVQAREKSISDIVGAYALDFVQADDMLVADRDMLVFTHRIMSYGNSLVGAVESCKSCGEPIKTGDVVIENMLIEYLEFDPLVYGENLFLWTHGRWQIVFKLPTVKLQRELFAVEDNGDSFVTSARVSMFVESVNGMESKRSALEAFSSMPVSVSLRFWKHFEKMEPFVHLVGSEITCPACKTDNTIRGPFSPEILPLCSAQAREIADAQFYELVKHGFSYSDLYRMPIENRRRLFEYHLAMLEEKAKNKSQGAPSA